MHSEDAIVTGTRFSNSMVWPKRLLVVSMLVYAIFLVALSFMRFAAVDETGYLLQAATIADALRHGSWFGHLPVGTHGFIIKTITALLFMVFGNSVFLATLVTAAITLITFWLCYHVLHELLHSQWWALVGTWLVFTNPVTIFCSYKYLVDVPAMGAVLLIIDAVFKRKRAWIIGLLLLLATDVREYLLFIIGPALIVWIVVDQVNRAIVTNEGANHTNEEKHVASRLYHVLLSCIGCIRNIVVRTTIVFLPVVLLIVLMLNTSLLPSNPALVDIVRAFNGNFISRMFLSPKVALQTSVDNIKAPQIDLIKIQSYVPAAAVQKTEVGRQKTNEVGKVADVSRESSSRESVQTREVRREASSRELLQSEERLQPVISNQSSVTSAEESLNSEDRGPRTEVSVQTQSTDHVSETTGTEALPAGIPTTSNAPPAEATKASTITTKTETPNTSSQNTDLGTRTSDLVAEPPVTTPAVTAPAVTAPVVTPPAVTPPVVTPPVVTPPTVTPPTVTPPAVTPPAVTPPAVTPPAVTPPAVTAPAVTEPASAAGPSTKDQGRSTAVASAPSTKDQGQSTAASSTTEDRGPRTVDRVQNSEINDSSLETTHDSQLTTHDQTPRTKDQGLSTSHIPQSSASPGLLDSPTSRRADEASQSLTAPQQSTKDQALRTTSATAPSTKDQALRTPPPPQPKPVVRKPVRQKTALCQNHGLISQKSKRNASHSANYASFLGERPGNLKPSSLSRGVLVCSLLTLPHGYFAMGAAMFTSAIFDIVNILIGIFNTLIIYSTKIVHPQTFNFNKLPHIVVFFAVPAAFIMSWSWLKKRQSAYLFVSMLFFLYMTIHIVKWSNIRYMLPFYPVVIFFFLAYLKLLTQRTILSILILSLTIVAAVFTLNIDPVNVPIKVAMTCACIIAVLVLVIARKRFPAYAIVPALFAPVLIAFFTLSSSLYLMLITRDNQGAPVRSFFEYGYNRECQKVMTYFSEGSTIWLNEMGNTSLSYFYRPDNDSRKIHLFDARSCGYLKYQAQKLNISEIGLIVSDLTGRIFQNQGLLTELKRADWLELHDRIKLKNKTLYLFTVHLSKQPLNALPNNRQVGVGLTPTLSFSGDSSTGALLVTQWQIREVSVLATQSGIGISNGVISSPESLGGSSWMSTDAGPYDFNGRSDYIDCNIPYQDYVTLSVWVKPHSMFQQSIIAGNFAGLANNYWNTYGKGLQYFNGSVYAMGDFDGCRKKLSAPLGDQEWSHIVATFSSNGTLFINGNLMAMGDIGAGYQYSFAIGAGRKHISTPTSTLNELNFYGYVDDLRVYNNSLTAAQVSNLWISTRDRYAHYGDVRTNADSSLCNKYHFGADAGRTTNAVLFSNKTIGNDDCRTINMFVERIWDSGEVTSAVRCIIVPEGVLTNGRAYYWQVRYKDEKGIWSMPSESTRFETVTDAQ